MPQVPAGKEGSNRVGFVENATASAASRQRFHCCRSLLAVCPASRQAWAIPASLAMRLQVPAGTCSAAQQAL